MAPYKTVVVDKSEHIARLTFNRPEANNAFNVEMLREIVQSLEDIAGDPDVRVMVLTGAGKHFCTSTDMDEFMSKDKTSLLGDSSVIEIKEFAASYPQRVTRMIMEMPKPTIAMVNGRALADGIDWVLACDLRVGSTKASFVQGYTSMAVCPNTGATWLLPRAIGVSKALEFLYLGGTIDASRAHELGILGRVVEPDKLEEETMSLARQVAAQPPIALRLLKMQVYKGLNLTLDQALELAADCEAMTLKTEDHKIAVAAFTRKEKPQYVGK